MTATTAASAMAINVAATRRLRRRGNRLGICACASAGSNAGASGSAARSWGGWRGSVMGGSADNGDGERLRGIELSSWLADEWLFQRVDAAENEVDTCEEVLAIVVITQLSGDTAREGIFHGIEFGPCGRH